MAVAVLSWINAYAARSWGFVSSPLWGSKRSGPPAHSNWRVRVFSLAIFVTVRHSIVRQPVGGLAQTSALEVCDAPEGQLKSAAAPPAHRPEGPFGRSQTPQNGVCASPPYSSPCRILSRCRNSAPYRLIRGSGVLFTMIGVSLPPCTGPGGDSSRSPKGRTIPPRWDQGNAPKALTLAFRLRAVLRPEAPKGRSTAAQANGLGSKSSPLSFGASPEGAKHELVAPFQGWVCQGRRCHSMTQAVGLGFVSPPLWGSRQVAPLQSHTYCSSQAIPWASREGGALSGTAYFASLLRFVYDA